MLDEAAKLKGYVDTINQLADLASGWIDVGSFTVSGPQGQTLLNAANAALGDLGLANWSSLVSVNGGGIDFTGFKNQVINLLPGGVGDEVNSLFDSLAAGDDGNGLSFTYPIVTEPSDVILGMLMGQDKNMVTAALTYKDDFDASFKIPIIPLFFIQVTAEANIDAYAQVGYDTRGLREAIAPLYNGGNFDSSKILDGLWIDPTTHVDVGGTVEVGPGFGVPDVVTFDLLGGSTGSLHANIDNPLNRDKIRPFAGDLTDRLFDVNGKISGVVSGTLKVGVDTPLGFVGFDKTWNFVEYTLYQFDTDRIGIPSSLVPPPPAQAVLFNYDPSTYTLTLNAGPYAGLRHQSEEVINETFSIEHLAHVVTFIPITGLIVTDVFEISAFGVTQLFTGRVDRLFADMGDGNDTIRVTDPYGGTLYSLYGGSGDDTIDIDGYVDEYIEGGDGHDTIDAGNGSLTGHQNNVDGGPAPTSSLSAAGCCRTSSWEARFTSIATIPTTSPKTSSRSTTKRPRATTSMTSSAISPDTPRR